MCTGSLTELRPGSHSLSHSLTHTHTQWHSHKLTNKREPHVYHVADRVAPRLSFSLSLSHTHTQHTPYTHHTHKEWHSHKLTNPHSDPYLHPPPYLPCASGTAGTAGLWGEARTRWEWAGWGWGTWGGGACRCGDCAPWWRTRMSLAHPRARCSHPLLLHINTETRKTLLIRWAYVSPSSNALWVKTHSLLTCDADIYVLLSQFLWNLEAE